MIGGVVAAAAVRTFPFRVFSFPTEFVRPDIHKLIVPGTLDEINRITLANLREDVLFDNFFIESPLLVRLRQMGLNDTADRLREYR